MACSGTMARAKNMHIAMYCKNGSSWTVMAARQKTPAAA